MVCGHARSTVLAEFEDIRAEVEALWEYHERRLRTGTPPERLMDRVAFSERPPYRLVQCTDCGLVYRNPAEREHELRAIYAREAPAPEVMRTLHETQLTAMRRQASALRRILGRTGSGLEVGSYVGAFLAAGREEGLQFEGLDINPDVNDFVRSLGFAAHDGDLDTFAPKNRSVETPRLFPATGAEACPSAACTFAESNVRDAKPSGQSRATRFARSGTRA